LIAFIDSVKEHQKVLFSKIEQNIVKALSLYQLKRRGEAIDTLAEAYRLAEPNNFTVPFIVYAKDMRTLTAFALKDGGCLIPRPWLEKINRKSSAYMKRRSNMISEYNLTNKIENTVPLSNREIEILKELTQGLSRAEIAVSQNISVNTVKAVIKVIYEKLCVKSLPEAIRAAIENKLI